MKKELETKLDAVLDKKLEALERMAPGSEEHSRLSADVSKLYQLVQADEKQDFYEAESDTQFDEREEAHKHELEVEKNERKRDWIKFAITTATGVATTVGGWFVFNKWYHEGLNFETDGTYTAKGGAQMIQRMMRPKH